ncbi:MAG: hypothetical protein ACI33I_12810 [Clostridium sp.]
MKVIDIKIKRISFDEYVFKIKNRKEKIRMSNDKFYLVDDNDKRKSGMFNDVHSCVVSYIYKNKLLN